MTTPEWRESVNRTLRQALQECGQLPPKHDLHLLCADDGPLSGVISERWPGGGFDFLLDFRPDSDTATLTFWFGENGEPDSFTLPTADPRRLYNILALCQNAGGYLSLAPAESPRRILVLGLDFPFRLSSLNGEALRELMTRAAGVSDLVFALLRAKRNSGNDLWSSDLARD